MWLKSFFSHVCAATQEKALHWIGETSMYVVDWQKAKAELSRLLALVESDEEVVIARCVKQIARLVRCNPKVSRKPDVLKETLQIPDTFFAPLASTDFECWEGR